MNIKSDYPITKKRNLQLIRNWRVIYLMSLAAKLNSLMILNRDLHQLMRYWGKIRLALGLVAAVFNKYTSGDESWMAPSVYSQNIPQFICNFKKVFRDKYRSYKLIRN